MTVSAGVATMAAMSYYQWQFLLVALAGWINRQQQDVIAYLMEENRVQRELLGSKRPRFSDEQRRRLAHAREHCHLYVDTDGLTVAEVAAAIAEFVDQRVDKTEKME
jgi:hypothetical protein